MHNSLSLKRTNLYIFAKFRIPTFLNLQNHIDVGIDRNRHTHIEQHESHRHVLISVEHLFISIYATRKPDANIAENFEFQGLAKAKNA